VLVDANLNGGKGEDKGMTVVLNTAQQAAKPKRYTGNYRTGSKLNVQRAGCLAYVEILDLPPSEVLVLAAHPDKEEGRLA